jgi:CBS domain-containing membrane protein
VSPAPDTRPSPDGRFAQAWQAWWRALWPAPLAVDWRERARVVLGAALGILLTAWIAHGLAGTAPAWPWLVAPLGASAVLVFGVPASPLAQPWPVIGGNTVSACIGILCARWIGPTELAAACAVGSAIAAMFALRCLHPPGGASALLVVLTHVTDPTFALHPVLLNSVLLVVAGMAYNEATRRAYPHRAPPPPLRAEAAGLDADLDAVLARHNQVIDIGRDDLKALLEDTRLQTYQRRLADIRCADIMSRGLVTVGHRTPLEEAWPLFASHRIKALPVVDAVGRLVGIVTPADFMRAVDPAPGSPLAQRLRGLRGLAGSVSEARVGDVMTRQVRVVSKDRHLADLVPLFAGTGHHHVPVVGEEGRLVGMITQSDVVAALALLPRPVFPVADARPGNGRG